MPLDIPSLIIDSSAPEHAQHLTTDINDALYRVVLAADTANTALEAEIEAVADDVAALVTTGTWTPMFTFATPGDLAVVYTNQVGTYAKIGSLVYVSFQISFTPTYTTSAGSSEISGVPYPGITSPGTVTSYGIIGNYNANITLPAGRTQLGFQVQGNPSLIDLIALGSGTAAAVLTPTEMVSGTAKVLRGNVWFLTP